jgi:catechol 2,3-dioxygenase-like lactoylglutathione lyase family enzyme
MYRSLLAIAVLGGCSAAQPEVHAASPQPAVSTPLSAINAAPLSASVLHFGFTVSSLDRAAHDFARLGFKPGVRRELSGSAFESLLHLPGAHAHTLELSLGAQTIELTAFEGSTGRAIPADSRSNDQWFQHIAIVVSDIDAAYARLQPGFAASAARGPEFYSTSPAPQTIPLSNPAAGGVRAFYFEDADRHDLELIWFPPGKGRPEWHAASPALFLGIDHSAIATADSERSLGTYRDALGLTIAGTSLNFGSEQEALSGVEKARVRITGLRGTTGPGVEFLQYLEPGIGKPVPADARANDLWHWEITVLVNDLERAAQAVEARGGHRISDQIAELPDPDLGYRRALLVRDPDGHALRLVQR